MNKEKNKRKTRRDLLLLAAVLLAISVAAVAVTPLRSNSLAARCACVSERKVIR